MIRRLLMSLVVGAAVVAVDRPEDGAEMAHEVERAVSFCTALPVICRGAAERALHSGGGDDYVRGDAEAKDAP